MNICLIYFAIELKRKYFHLLHTLTSMELSFMMFDRSNVFERPSHQPCIIISAVEQLIAIFFLF